MENMRVETEFSFIFVMYGMFSFNLRETLHQIGIVLFLLEINNCIYIYV